MLLKVKPIDLIQNKDIKFGTSGLRGLVSDFSDVIIASYTVAFIKHLQKRGFKFKKIVVGNDLRASSNRIVNSVFHGIHQCNLIPIYAGPVPTPALTYYGMQHNLPTIMVTGSHIPDDRNGLKFSTPSGEITKEDEYSINNFQLQLEISGFNKSGILKVKEYARKDSKVLALYKLRYQKIIPENLLAGLRIGLYEHSSVARDFYKDLYKSLGAEIISFGRSNTFLPVDTEAVRKEDIALIRGWCSLNKVHCILSSDGDADRPLIFDEDGELIKGDILGILVSKILKADVVVTPISSNTALDKCNWFNKIIKTKIGSPYVLEAMYKEEGNVIGFEANGGLLHKERLNIFNNYLEPLPTRDSTLVHICFLLAMLGNKIPASKLKLLLPARFTCSDVIKNIDIIKVRDFIESLKNIKHGSTFLSKHIIKELNVLDGIRMITEQDDIIHLRLSGNAPELRIYCESGDSKKSEILLAGIIYDLKELDII